MALSQLNGARVTSRCDGLANERDLAAGIVAAMLHPRSINQDFNLSTAASTTVLELAALIWRKIHGPVASNAGSQADAKPFRYVSDPAFTHDVQLRVPDVSKARAVLGFEATTSLDTMLDEVIPWVKAELEAGRI